MPHYIKCLLYLSTIVSNMVSELERFVQRGSRRLSCIQCTLLWSSLSHTCLIMNLYYHVMRYAGCNLVTFLNRTPKIDWCGITNKHHKGHIFKRDWTSTSYFIDFLTLNSEHNWEDLSIQLRKFNKHAFPITIRYQYIMRCPIFVESASS